MKLSEAEIFICGPVISTRSFWSLARKSQYRLSIAFFSFLLVFWWRVRNVLQLQSKKQTQQVDARSSKRQDDLKIHWSSFCLLLTKTLSLPVETVQPKRKGFFCVTGTIQNLFLESNILSWGNNHTVSWGKNNQSTGNQLPPCFLCRGCFWWWVRRILQQHKQQTEQVDARWSNHNVMISAPLVVGGLAYCWQTRFSLPTKAVQPKQKDSFFTGKNSEPVFQRLLRT